MVIVLKPGTSESEIQEISRQIHEMGYQPHVIRGEFRTVIGAVGDERVKAPLQNLEAFDCVESVVPILQPFKLASREIKATDTVIPVNGVAIGGSRLARLAGGRGAG